jgi:hypothetical protein
MTGTPPERRHRVAFETIPGAFELLVVDREFLFLLSTAERAAGARLVALALHRMIEAGLVDLHILRRRVSSMKSYGTPKVSYSLNAASPGSER